MIWYICFFCTVAVALGAFALTVFSRFGKNRGKKAAKGIQIWFGACFLMVILLMAPAYSVTYGGQALAMLKVLAFSVRIAVRAFGGEALADVVLKQLDAAPEGIRGIYAFCALTVQLVAPLLSFGLVLSFFRNVSAYVRYVLAFFRETYIFSEPNERSVTLARDILQHHPAAQIVFTDVRDKAGEPSAKWVESIRQLRAICFRKDLNSVNFRLHHPGNSLYFFVMGKDELQNMDKALRLVESYNMRDKTHLYIFSSGVEGELLLAGKEKGKMKVRRVNEIKSLVYRILYEEGEKIFRAATPISGSDQKQISAVIVGLGSRGTEMLKALTWYCQMDGYRLQIHAFDRDPLARERLEAQCPELMSREYNGVCAPGQAEYTITVHDGCDVDTSGFAALASAVRSASYVFVSLGSEEANIATAVNLRMLYERVGAKPLIHTVIAGSKAKKALSAAKNYAGQPYAIDFVGDIAAFYSEDVILESEVEADAFARHCAYCNGDADREEDFWRYEYCYRSSMATAIHAVARICCGIPGAEKPEDTLTPEERKALENLEHRRWNAYMRSEGYIYSGSPDRSSRNDLAKMHHNLVAYERLADADKRKDSRVAASPGSGK